MVSKGHAHSKGYATSSGASPSPTTSVWGVFSHQFAVDLSLTSGAVQHGPVRKLDFQKLTAVRAVAKRMDGRRHDHSGCDRFRHPALTYQAARAGQLDRPLFQSTSSFHNQQDPGVRIGPLEGLDRALHGNLPFGIKPRE